MMNEQFGTGTFSKVPVKSNKVPWWAGACVALVITVGAGGFFHFVHGGNTGCKIISKESWGIDETFVDLDDYVGKSMIQLMPDAKVVRALFASGILRRP